MPNFDDDGDFVDLDHPREEFRIKFLPGPHLRYFERLRAGALLTFYEDLGRGRLGIDFTIRLSRRPSVSPGQSVQHDRSCRAGTEWILSGHDELAMDGYMLVVAEDGCGIAYPDSGKAF